MLAQVYATAFPTFCLCHTRALYQNGQTFRRNSFITWMTDSPIILIFRQRGLLLNSDGFTPSGDAKYNGEVRKFGELWLISWCISETVRYTAIVATEVEQGTMPKLSNDGIVDDLEWPQFQGHTTVRRRISRKQCMLRPATWRRARFTAIAEVSCWDVRADRHTTDAQTCAYRNTWQPGRGRVELIDFDLVHTCAVPLNDSI